MGRCRAAQLSKLQQIGKPGSPKRGYSSAVVRDCGRNDCFKKILGPSERSLVSELHDVRNRWAHQKAFSTDDAYRAIDSTSRLMSAVSADVEIIEQMKAEILRSLRMEC
jgi:Swt1-like HEPN